MAAGGRFAQLLERSRLHGPPGLALGRRDGGAPGERIIERSLDPPF
jgi:hypothetical protein